MSREITESVDAAASIDKFAVVESACLQLQSMGVLSTLVGQERLAHVYTTHHREHRDHAPLLRWQRVLWHESLALAASLGRETPRLCVGMVDVAQAEHVHTGTSGHVAR